MLTFGAIRRSQLASSSTALTELHHSFRENHGRQIQSKAKQFVKDHRKTKWLNGQSQTIFINIHQGRYSSSIQAALNGLYIETVMNEHINQMNRRMMNNQLTDWLMDWLMDWLIDWLIDWWIDWLMDWLIDWVIDWWSDWLTLNLSYQVSFIEITINTCPLMLSSKGADSCIIGDECLHLISIQSSIDGCSLTFQISPACLDSDPLEGALLMFWIVS